MFIYVLSTLIFLQFNVLFFDSHIVSLHIFIVIANRTVISGLHERKSARVRIFYYVSLNFYLN